MEPLKKTNISNTNINLWQDVEGMIKDCTTNEDAPQNHLNKCGICGSKITRANRDDDNPSLCEDCYLIQNPIDKQ